MLFISDYVEKEFGNMRYQDTLSYQQCYEALTALAQDDDVCLTPDVIAMLAPSLMQQADGQRLMLEVAAQQSGCLDDYLVEVAGDLQSEVIESVLGGGNQHRHQALLRRLAKHNELARHLLESSQHVTSLSFRFLFGRKPYLTALPRLIELVEAGALGVTRFLKARLSSDVLPTALIEVLFSGNNRYQWLELLSFVNQRSASREPIVSVLKQRLQLLKIAAQNHASKRHAAICITGVELHEIFIRYRQALKLNWVSSTRMQAFRRILRDVPNTTAAVSQDIVSRLRAIEYRTTGGTTSHIAQREVAQLLNKDVAAYWLQRAAESTPAERPTLAAKLARMYPYVDIMEALIDRKQFALLTDVSKQLQSAEDRLVFWQSLELSLFTQEYDLQQLAALYRLYRGSENFMPECVSSAIIARVRQRIIDGALPCTNSDCITVLKLIMKMQLDDAPEKVLAVLGELQSPLSPELQSQLAACVQLIIGERVMGCDDCLQLALVLKPVSTIVELAEIRRQLLDKASRMGAASAYSELYGDVDGCYKLYQLARKGHVYALVRLFDLVADQGELSDSARFFLMNYFQCIDKRYHHRPRLQYAARWAGTGLSESTPTQLMTLSLALQQDQKSLLFRQSDSADSSQKIDFLYQQLRFHLMNMGLGGTLFHLPGSDESFAARGYSSDEAMRFILALFGQYIDQKSATYTKQVLYKIECALSIDCECPGLRMHDRLLQGQMVSIPLVYDIDDPDQQELSHAVRIAFVKIGDYYYMAYANRGYWTRDERPGLHIFQVTKPERLKQDSFAALLSSSVTGSYLEDFDQNGNGLGAALGLKRITYLPKKPQKSGNCSLLSMYNAVQLAMMVDRIKQSGLGRESVLRKRDWLFAARCVQGSYKSFRDFARVESLKAILTLADPTCCTHIDDRLTQGILFAAVKYCERKAGLRFDPAPMLHIVDQYYQRSDITIVSESIKQKTLTKVRSIIQSLEEDFDSDLDDASVLSL